MATEKKIEKFASDIGFEPINNEISIQTGADSINLTVQQKELSDFRTSGIYASEFKGLFSYKNWHKENFDQTLKALEALSDG